MAVCTNCGKEFDRIGTNCPYCHAKIGLSGVTTKKNVDKALGYDDKSKGLMILSIIVPIYGYYEYYKNREEYPLRTSSQVIGAFIGTVIYLIIITIIVYLLLFK